MLYAALFLFYFSLMMYSTGQRDHDMYSIPLVYYCRRPIRNKIGSNESTVFKFVSEDVAIETILHQIMPKNFNALLFVSLLHLFFFSSASFLIRLKSLKIYRFWYGMMLNARIL